MTNVSFGRIFEGNGSYPAVWDTCEKRSFESGELALGQGDPVEGVHLVVSGALTGFGDTVEGKRVMMTSMAPGSMMGEADVFQGHEFSSGGYLVVQDCELLFMERDRFLACMADEQFAVFVVHFEIA